MNLGQLYQYLSIDGAACDVDRRGRDYHIVSDHLSDPDVD